MHKQGNRFRISAENPYPNLGGIPPSPGCRGHFDPPLNLPLLCSMLKFQSQQPLSYSEEMFTSVFHCGVVDSCLIKSVIQVLMLSTDDGLTVLVNDCVVSPRYC